GGGGEKARKGRGERGEAGEPVPMPRAKPDTIARVEPETTGSAPASETEHAMTSAPAAQDMPSSRKSRARRDAREHPNSRTASPRDRENARPVERIDETREVREFTDETRDQRSGGDEPRATHNRNTEQATRSSRSRRIEVKDDKSAPAARTTRVRGDERRVVIERAAEPGRAYVREEKPRMPFPFFFGNND